MIKKPENFDDLLNLQKMLDENIGVERENKFIPRNRTEIDILDSIKDEKQEWLRELPYNLNFKTWKEKKYDRNKEREEITDILFFILQLANYADCYKSIFRAYFENWNEENYGSEFSDESLRKVLTTEFEQDLLNEQYRNDLMRDYNNLCRWRKFSKQDILNEYWSKWQKNMKRPSEDWTLKQK